MSDAVWLVGVGPMAREYARVLDDLGVPFQAIGRGEASAGAFQAATGRAAHTGGIERFLQDGAPPPRAAVVAVGVDRLADATSRLLAHGVRHVLVEKPGGLGTGEIDQVAGEAAVRGARVCVAYNRRFFASTRRAREIVAEDGGVSSFTFEFTEWRHQVEAHPAPRAVKERWLLANSSHVIDLAFFLGGAPHTMSCFTAGALEWHPRAAAFSGAGVTAGGVPFAYHANWDAPGRWGVEVSTRSRRLVFRPMEKLQVQRRKSVALEEEPLDDDLDRRFKPGLWRLTQAFLDGERGVLPEIAAQAEAARWYERIESGDGAG